jgi:hypothetical protein
MIRPTKAARKRTYVQAHHGSGRRARRPDASSGAPAAAAPTRVPACCAGAGDRARPVVWRRAVLCTPCCLVWSTELIGCARYSMLLHVPARGKGRRSTDHDQSINGRCHLALRRCRCMTASLPCMDSTGSGRAVARHHTDHRCVQTPRRDGKSSRVSVSLTLALLNNEAVRQQEMHCWRRDKLDHRASGQEPSSSTVAVKHRSHGRRRSASKCPATDGAFASIQVNFSYLNFWYLSVT